MRDIKMKQSACLPKVKELPARMPKEAARLAALEAKEESRRMSDGMYAKEEGESPTGYASGKIESAQERMAGRTALIAFAVGRKMAEKSYQKIRDKKSAERTAGKVRETAEQTAGQGRHLPAPPEKGVKTAMRDVKSSAAPEQIRAGRSIMKRQQAAYIERTARQMAVKSAETTQTAGKAVIPTGEKAVRSAGKGMGAAVKAALSTARSAWAFYIGGAGAAVLLVILLGVIGGALFSGSSQSELPLSEEVQRYTPLIQKYAGEYGIPEYVPAIQAIMMQESGGKGSDLMQASECPYNTKYPHSPNAIKDPEYSIQVGIQYYAACVREARCKDPQDMDRLKLSLQGYNYGNGYISWAVRNYGGYSEANARLFSRQQAAAHGWPRYGDPEYVPHVLRYYSGGNIFAGLFGNSQIVSVAMSQLGNEGGRKYWSWYGFDGHVAWCACFVSWCADQSGLIANGTVPKFCLCTDGVSWFASHGKWKGRGYYPTPGMIIFFDWDGDGSADHVGIVEKCENGKVYTVEGNSGNAVRKRSYAVNSRVILGYGLTLQ